jgi:hypothetical protein
MHHSQGRSRGYTPGSCLAGLKELKFFKCPTGRVSTGPAIGGHCPFIVMFLPFAYRSHIIRLLFAYYLLYSLIIPDICPKHPHFSPFSPVKTMAIIKNNPVMATASGKVGVVYFRQVRGKLFVCNKPPRGLPRSPKQLENQRRFGNASKGSKALLKDPEMKALYQARVDNDKFTAHMVAQSDLMKAPTVKSIDASAYKGTKGDVIAAQAKKDFKVSKVVVTITDKSGQVIESGEAAEELLSPDTWLYTATTDHPDLAGSVIQVKAIDVPGNTTTKELLL